MYGCKITYVNAKSIERETETKNKIKEAIVLKFPDFNLHSQFDAFVIPHHYREEEPLDGDGIVVAAEETLALDDFKTCPDEFKAELL